MKKYQFICKTDLYNASRHSGFNHFTGEKVMGEFDSLKEANEAVFESFKDNAERCFANWGLACIYASKPNDEALKWAGTVSGMRYYSCDIFDYRIKINEE